MPRATSQRFRGDTAGKQKSEAKDSKASHPYFNTGRFGQHILKNTSTAQSIVDAANLKPTDTVLEVGPGTGNLAVHILEKAKQVIAIEHDPRMAAEVIKHVQARPDQRKLEVVVGDFVKVDLPYFDVCISNTPYQISSPLVFRLLSHRPLCRTAILMFQREFAMRLVARPDTSLWSRLSASVQLYAKVDVVMHVPRNDFIPPPQVDSTVVRIQPLDPPPPVKPEEFDGLTRLIFSRPNKTIHANFQAKGVMKMLEQNRLTWLAVQDTVPMPDASNGDIVEKVLADVGGDKRAAKMDLNDILRRFVHQFAISYLSILTVTLACRCAILCTPGRLLSDLDNTETKPTPLNEFIGVVIRSDGGVDASGLLGKKKQINWCSS